MQINVYPHSRSRLREIDSTFALQKDDWNDYSFRTLYHLYYKSRETGATVLYVGAVKILKAGQTNNSRAQINEPFTSLSDDFCSVGTSLDYYQRLNKLSKKDRQFITRAINDVAARPKLQERFSAEEGWRTSLFRENSAWKSFLSDAAALFNGNFDALPELKTGFSFAPRGAKQAISLEFNAPEPYDYVGKYRRVGPSKKKTLLPQRIVVFVGRNGSGKSTLLSRIAHVAFAAPEMRATKEIRAMGSFTPPGIGFMRIIALSYSAFDNFALPGTGERNVEQIADDIESGDGRFIYCGLRDIANEAREEVEVIDAQDASDDDMRIHMSERRKITKLKSVEQLADEFSRLIKQIKRASRVDLFDAAIDPLRADPSFAELLEDYDHLMSPAKAKKLFLSWSTGHKIVLHAITSIVANSIRRALVLFDEPETHLHPPLAAALMHSIRIVLEEVDAFCIMATHSPVLLQETLARHVRIIERNGERISIKSPRSETFGENVGILTYSTFGLTAGATDFHNSLDLLVDGCDSIEEIDDLFTPGLSAQARAYVAARLAETGDE